MPGRRSKLLVLVVIFFAYSAMRGVQSLFLHDQSAGDIVHENVGLLPQYFVATIGLTILSAAAAVLLWHRHPLGLYVGLVTLTFGLVELLLELEVVASDLEIARHAYSSSRNARGLSLAPGRLDQVVTPATVAWARKFAFWVTGIATGCLLLGWFRSAPARPVRTGRDFFEG